MAREKYSDVDNYVSNFPEDVQLILEELRVHIRNVVPEAVECISYNIPAYKLNGKQLIYFAAFQNHIGMYPAPSGVGEFIKAFAPYKTGKGSVQFPLGKALPYKLIDRIIRYRLKKLAESARK